MGETINFYHTDGPYGFLSNFARYPLDLKNRRWPTSEHYFQAQKFSGMADEEEIRRASSPRMAARMGRERHRPLRQDWESVKEAVMREALWAKFTQHPSLREKLLSTGSARLVEHTEKDAYWGDGGDGSGKNRLGILLEEIRDRLRETTS